MNCSCRLPFPLLATAFVAVLQLVSWSALAQCPDTNANGTCDEDESGCTIELACNYDADAVFADNASCDFESCLSFGCTDASACNYDEDATYNDGSCTYASFPFNCEGECVNDVDMDGVCDEFETPGCTDENACNYSPDATLDNGTCAFDCGGCTIAGACNFDPEALQDDGSCDFTSCLALGCTDASACNYDADAALNDGSCDFVSCLGCIDADACNFDPSSTQDDGSCVFPEAEYDCDGACLSDTDGDGVCDGLEVAGCTDSTACNYDDSATDDNGSCDFCSCADAGGLTTSSNIPGYDVAVETVMEHSDGELAGMTTYRVYLTLASATDAVSAVVGDNEFPLSLSTTTSFYQEPIFGGVTPANISAPALGLLPSLAYDSWVTIGLEGPASSANGEVNASLLAGTWDDAFEDGDSFLVDDNTGSGWYLLPPTATNGMADANQRVLIAQLTTDGDISGSFRAQVLLDGVEGDESDHRVDATFSMGGSAPVCGCTDELASNYNPDATLNDGSCIFDVPGCTVELACNYDVDATVDDGSCDFVSCLTFGCTDSEACNYDDDATFDDGSCNYPAFPYDCEGNCVNDNDADGVCDEFEIFGCTDQTACNYSSGATDDDGSCDYDCLGCTNPAACNFDGEALIDDGSCEFLSCINVGCTDETACNYDADADYNDGSCTFIPEGACDCDGNALDALGICGGGCESDDNGNGVCDDAEVLGCTSSFACNFNPEATVDDGSCDFISCLAFGCTDPTACNFDPSAQFDDGTCVFAQAPFDCDGNCVNDADGDGVCDEFEIPGCTDDSACNYNEDATDEAGNCVYADPFYDCNGVCLNDLDGDGVCDELEVLGCTAPTACNYAPLATEDDGSCVYEDECGICDGPGAIYECGCSDIPEGDCDCDGNVLDECGVCGGDGIPAGDCDCDGNQLDALGECGGPCEADADSDGICDDVDPCVGELDACGVCNGPGEIYECGCADIPEGDCDCNGNVLDECGVCGGDGIPAGDCDCDGNQLDALGECGGPCEADADSDGICDDVDPCVGELDACGVCNGPGEIYECGCADIPEGDCDCDGNVLDECSICGGDGIPAGDCDCDGNQLDALGECGGPCEADANGNGICDSEDIPGCTIQIACNYNAEATVDDGSCDFISCLAFGCTDENACNYDPAALFEDGSCEYANFPLTAMGPA